MMTGSLKKKKKLKDFFFFLNFKKRGGGSLIRACSLIRSNTVFIILDNLSQFYFVRFLETTHWDISYL